MTSNNAVDAARVELLLSELRLPAIKLMWAALAARADKEGWPAARFLAALAEQEMADRGRRRIERHLASARLPAGKTFDTFDFNAVPMVSKAQVMALAAGDGWLDQGANILLFGPPESDSYCSSLDLPTIPALFVADCQTADAEVGEPALLL
jgi:DNA replication protein DnaC